MQENSLLQGRQITSLEMKSDALSRKKQYDAELKATMLRMRGTFADVLLGTKKELQNSIDESFAAQADEMEMSFTKRLAEMEKKLEKKFTKKAIDAEHSFAMQSKERENKLKEKESHLAKKKADMEHSFARKKEELQITFAKIMESNQASVNIDMTHMRTQLSQAEQTVSMLQSQMNQNLDISKMEVARLQNELGQAQAQARELDMAKNVAQHQLSQEREGLRQRIANVENGRAEALSKLATTLHTLETTCTSAQGLEARLREKEAMLHDMEERWSVVNERAFLLNNQLDNEVKNKNALVNVQKEMEKHLSLERERADLLQQKLDAFKEADYQQRGELDRASQDNTHLKNELDRASQDNTHLKNQLDQLGGELDRASQENMHLKNELDRVGRELGEELDRASKENKALKNELDRVHQQLAQELGRTTEENKQLKSELERWGEDNMHLKSENDRFSQHLHIANEVGLTLKTNLTALQKDFEEQVQVSQSSASECLELKRVCQEFNIKMNNLSEINSLLEFKVERLEAKVLDQVIDLEAARMSEAEVEKSLAECEHNRLELDELTQHLDAELRKTLNECEKINELFEEVSNEKREMAAVLEEQIREIEAMKLKSAEDEHACNEERTEITGLLAGFDAEMSIAEEKLKSVLQSNADLESEIASLKAHLESEREASNMKLENSQIVIETLQDEVQKRLQAFKEKEETLKKNMQDEINNIEDQFVRINDECNARLSKYEADIGVYEEAIQMLRNQVHLLQKLQHSQNEESVQLTESEESRIDRSTEGLEAMKDKLTETMKEKLKDSMKELKEELKETMDEDLNDELKKEARQEFLPSINHERLEKVNVDYWENIDQKIEQHTTLDLYESTQSTQCNQSNQSNESINDDVSGVIEVVVKETPRSFGEISQYL